MKLKKLLVFGIVGLLTFGGIIDSNYVSASKNEEIIKDEFIQSSKIISKKELIEVIKEVNESTEVSKLPKDDIIEIFDSIDENTTKEAKIEYRDQMKEELNHKLNNLNNSKLNTEGFVEEQITLSDGSEVNIETSDLPEEVDENELPEEYIVEEEEDSDLPAEDFVEIYEGEGIEINRAPVFSGIMYSPYRSEKKDYGARRYSSIITFRASGLNVGKLYLRSHYSVGDYGLKMRYSSKSGTRSYLPKFDISRATAKTTDSKAPVEGHDINSYGEYTVKIDLLGWLGGSRYYDIRSQIKLKKLDKKEKYAYVAQSYVFN